MSDFTVDGEPSTAVDLLRADTSRLVYEWRRACTAEGRRVDAAEERESDELAGDRARAVITATGPAVFSALASLLENPEQLEGPGSPLHPLADAMVAHNLGIEWLVRQAGILRQVLQVHLVQALPQEAAAEARQQLTMALDELMAVCAARAEQRLEKAAFLDPLTGLFNRRALDRDLPREVAVAERHGRRLSVLMSDVDGFAKINERQGHLIGDEALRSMAGALRSALRAGDSAYRLDGDEFIVVLPEMGTEDVAQFVQRVRAGAPPAFSWGAATFPDEVTNRPSLLDLADRRLIAYRQATGSAAPSSRLDAAAATIPGGPTTT